MLVGTEEEYQALAGGFEPARKLAPGATAVLKLGARGAKVALSGQKAVEAGGFPVEVLNTLGAGDAFLAGFLSGWLRDLPVLECLRRGNANGALVVTRHGCAPAMPYALEVEEFLARGLTPRVDRLHAAGALKPPPQRPLAILAIDHRTWFSQRCQDDERVGRFKLAACQAVAERFRQRSFDCELGFILDREECLGWADAEGFWTAQCLEEPSSTPLRVIGADAGVTLRSRPRRRAVKLLVTWPGGEGQRATLEQVVAACRALGRELILEVLRPDQGCDLAAEMQELSDLSPDWWKVPVGPDPARIAQLASRDECCRGVLWLGGGEPLEELSAQFGAVARLPASKGFAVGRTVFEEAFLEDQPGLVADHFERLVRAWGL